MESWCVVLVVLCLQLSWMCSVHADESNDAPASIHYERTGNDVKLPCIELRGDEKVGGTLWYRNKVFLLSRGTSTSVRYADNDYKDSTNLLEYNTLVLYNVTVEDSGNYTCKVYILESQNAEVSERNVTRTLIVQARNAPPRIVKHPETVLKVAEGQTAILTCESTGNPKPSVVWFKVQGSNRQMIVGPRFEILDNGNLVIKDVNDGDSGNYRCDARNMFGKDSAQGSLVVRERTVIVALPLDARQTEGSDATFLCGAVTDPHERQSYHWLRDGQAIDISDPRMDHSGGTLTIRNITTKDTGAYTCIASNGLDNDTAMAMLEVEGPPDPPHSVTLESCYATGANVRWEFNADQENFSPLLNFIVEYNTSFSPEEWVIGDRPPASSRRASIRLSLWVKYNFRVKAENSIGVSQPSDLTRHVCQTPQGRPDRHPRNVKTVGDKTGFLVIEWEPMPPIEHNAPGFVYKITVKETDGHLTMRFQESDYTVGRKEILVNHVYRPYDITVRAENRVGQPIVKALTVHGFSSEAEPKSVPQNFELDPDEPVRPTSVSFRWDPVDTSVESIQGEFKGYKIRFWKPNQKANTLQEMVVNKQGEHSEGKVKAELNSLSPYTTFMADVVAINNYFSSNGSNVVVFTTAEGVPSAVENPEAVYRGSTHFLLEWGVPKEPNGVIIGYRVEYQKIRGLDSEGHKTTLSVPVDRRRISVGGLMPDTLYGVNVLALSRRGESVKSYVEVRTTDSSYASLAPPSITDVVSTSTSMNVTWTPTDAKNKQKAVGEHFFLEFREIGGNWKRFLEEKTVDFWKQVTGLQSGSRYEVRVIATVGEPGALNYYEKPSDVRIAKTTGEGTPGIPPSIKPIVRKNVYYVTNEDFTLECEAEGIPEPVYHWLKNGKMIMVESEERVSVLPGVGSLRIKRATGEDTGVYQCVAENQLGKSLSDKYNVQLSMMTRFPTIERKVLVTDVPLGFHAKLPCLVPLSIPPAKSAWVIESVDDSEDDFRDELEDEYPTDGFTNLLLDDRITTDWDGNLYITNTLLSDEYVYRCLSQNRVLRVISVGPKTHLRPVGSNAVGKRGNLPVKLLWSSPTDVVGLLKQNITFKCIFAGNPRVSIVWRRQGYIQDSRMVNDSFEFTIHNVQYKDKGTYLCEGRQPGSQPVQQKFFLTVQSKPEWVKEPENIAAGVGENVVFTCAAEGRPMPVIQWYINGEPVEQEAINPKISLMGNKLEFINLTSSDSRVVQCNASNVHGYLWTDVYLSVQGLQRPTIVQIMTKVRSVNITWDRKGVSFVEYRRMGEEDWQRVLVDDREHTWQEIEGLETETPYEVRVVVAGVTLRDMVKTSTVMTFTTLGIPNIRNIWAASATANVTWVVPHFKNLTTDAHFFLEYRKFAEVDWKRTTAKDSKYFWQQIEGLRPVNSYEVRVVATGLDDGDVTSDINIFHTVDIPDVPPVIKPILQRTVHFVNDETLTLECEAEGRPKPIYHWLKNGKMIMVESEERVSVLPGVGSLRIKGATGEDTGVYQCVAENQLGKSFSDKYNVQLSWMQPFPVSVRKTLKVPVGDPAVIQCNAPPSNPPAKLGWDIRSNEDYVDEFEKEYSDILGGLRALELNERITTDSEGNLYITSTRTSDEFVYSCSASNAILRAINIGSETYLQPTGSEPHTSSVALMWSSPKYVIGLVAEKVTFKCIFSGNPQATIVWTRRGGNLDKNRMRQSNDSFEFEINNVRYKDAGTYVCEGSQPSAQPVQQTFYLKVQAKPEWQKKPWNSIAVVGKNAEFICAAKGRPMPVITWYINGDPVERYSSDARIRLRRNRLKFKDLKISDSWVLQCNASNLHGYLWTEVSLTVQGPPQPSIVKINTKVKSAIVTWFFDESRCIRKTLTVEYRRMGEENWQRVETRDRKKTWLKVEDLVAGATYEVRVVATSAGFPGMFLNSSVMTFTTIGMPTINNITSTSTSANVTWDVPHFKDVGSKTRFMARFFLEYRKRTEVTWVKTNEKGSGYLWQQIADLEPGNSYEVRVVATGLDDVNVTSDVVTFSTVAPPSSTTTRTTTTTTTPSPDVDEHCLEESAVHTACSLKQKVEALERDLRALYVEMAAEREARIQLEDLVHELLA